jgi:prolyl-tRNA synthetase
MGEKNFVEAITDIEKDFPQWYTDIVLKTELADYGVVKGTMVIRPYGFALWENIEKGLDKKLKSAGYQNAYFPLLIPQSFIEKEAKHIEGFAPELATVTQVGNEPLPEKLVVRPTSETIIGTMMSKWLQSYKELPMKLNQWCNVVRWEKTTRPFLRTSEFLWHEAHAAFPTAASAEKTALDDLYMCEKFCREYLALPVLVGEKTEKERFAGAEITYGIEGMMKDGKSLQCGTSHYLGRNFTTAFDIKFQNDKGVEELAYTTSLCGATTRLIGAIVMTHGDNRGLVLPPYVAPVQVIIIPIQPQKDGVTEKSIEIQQELKKLGNKDGYLRAEIDNTDNTTGWKFNQWEMKGVPIRIEIGPRDIEKGECVLFRRDTLTKETVKLTEIPHRVPMLLDEINKTMLANAEKNRNTRIKNVTTFDELKNATDTGNFAFADWCGERECEDKIKTDTNGVTTRVIPFDQPKQYGKCVCCGRAGKKRIYFARAY